MTEKAKRQTKDIDWQIHRSLHGDLQPCRNEKESR